MAGVAGAIAMDIGKAVKGEFNTKETVIENGGDIYLDIKKPLDILIYAGGSPLSGRIAIRVHPEHSPLGVCTSSGTIGHSLSFGKADAVVIACKNACLADAYATKFANLVRYERDIKPVLKMIKKNTDIIGGLIILDKKIGVTLTQGLEFVV